MNIYRLFGLCLVAACGAAPRPVPSVPSADGSPVVLSGAPRIEWARDFGSGILAPLLLRGPVGFVATTNRTVQAFSTTDGRRFWLQRFDGPASTGVVEAGGRLYQATEELRGEAFALDVTRGRPVWKRRIGGTRAPPLLLEQTIVFGTLAGTLYALRTQDGSVNWQIDLGSAIALHPLRAGNRIVVATAADSIYQIDPASGTIERRATLPATPAGPALVSGAAIHIPLHDGSVVRLQAETLRVEQRYELGTVSLASPIPAGNAIYVLTRAAEVWRLADQPVRLAALGGAARAAFAYAPDQLIVGLLDGRIVGLDLSGRQRWQLRAERSVAGPIAVASDGVFVSLINGKVLKIK